MLNDRTGDEKLTGVWDKEQIAEESLSNLIDKFIKKLQNYIFLILTFKRLGGKVSMHY